MNKQYERKVKENKPVVAICYDFDKTLTPDDMQAQGFIQSVGYDVSSFWEKSNGLAEQNDMDQNLAYMYTMLHESEGKVLFTKKSLKDYGAKIQLFPGVKDWFERIRAYAKEKGVIVEHYIISSGLKEMIEGTIVAPSFERIYASSFYYNERDVAEWPAQVVNYTNKTQFLFRIEKGTLDINDSGINDYFPTETMRVPFRNIIYIGDSDTDIPCMKLVNSNGGHSIGVYNPESQKKDKVYKMMHDKRIKYFAPADYREGSELDTLVKAIIDRTYYNELLEDIHIRNKKEYEQDEANFSDEEKRKKSLLLNLEESGSFKTTHTIISELRKVDNWTLGEIDWLIDIALSNNQVGHILKDNDVSRFYKSLIEDGNSEKASKLNKILDEK
ncbi:MAG TPA: haloacid dehalogenase [Treponema sp.]|nr:haloacid dehalogenase [Treponema sp.]